MTQFSRYEVPQKDFTTSRSTSASWILHHFKPFRQLHSIDKQELMAVIYEQLNKTTPVFSEREKENMIVILKQRLQHCKAVEPKKTRRVLLSLISLLDKCAETTRWFIFFMEFYKNGIIYTSRNLMKRPMVLPFMSPTKKQKRQSQPEK